jgi:ribosomal protein S18 acetylase RimI-like enzyme
MTQPEVEYRAATAADEPFLTEMLWLAFNWRKPPSQPPAVLPPVLSKYVQGFGRPGDTGVVAVRDGAPSGAAWYRFLPAGAKGYGFVSDEIPELSLAVSPAARRLGIATGVLERLLERAREQGVASISLSVEPDNPALLLYERAGFVRVGRVEGSVTMLRSWRARGSQGA